MPSSATAPSFSRRFANGTTTQAGDGNPSRNIATVKARPNCTHPTVDRLYGPFSCDLCHRSSPLQWIYLCTLDSCNDYKTSPVDSVFSDVSTTAKGNIQDDLRALGFSESILAQAEAGIYTPEQIETLKKQKLNLTAVIAGTPPPSSTDKTSLPSRSDDSVGRNTLKSNKTTSSRSSRPEPCHFKACHHCRPYLHDRSWTSFEAVYRGEARPLTMTDRYTLPIKDANIARSIGLYCPATQTSDTDMSDRRHNPSSDQEEEDSPISGTSSSAMDSDDYSSDWEDEFDSQHRTNPTGSTIIYSLHSHVYHNGTPPRSFAGQTLRRISGSISDSPSQNSSTSSSNSPRATTTSTARTSPLPQDREEEEEFDISLAAARRNKNRSSEQQTRNTHHCQPPNLAAVLLQGSSCEESLSGEMEVDGGVALTEEAFRTHTPDVLTRV